MSKAQPSETKLPLAVTQPTPKVKKASWRDRVHEHLSFDKSQREHEFLPAALEVRETPPSPIGRAIIWVILLFFSIAVAWASIGHIDIVAVAPGKIITEGYSKVIQPLETASVKAIQVKEGQAVKAGDVLIELDTRLTQADVTRLSQEHQEAKEEVHRLEQLSHWCDQADQASNQQPLPADLILQARIQEQQARLEALHSERKKTVAEHAAIQKQVEKLKAIMPLVTQRASNFEKLTEKKYAAREKFLELEQQRLETQHDLFALEKQAEELQQSVEEVSARIDHTKKAFRKETLEQLREARIQQHSLNQELHKAETHHQQMTLTAPVSGVVQQLQVHSIGAVVSPAQELMVIVPEQRTLQVEALLLNKDIGFVQEGQEAEVKIDAFNFTQYGVIPATITDISDDAVEDENLGWAYKLKIDMQRSQIEIKGKNVELTPGMTVMAEVKTGKRRIIEYLLSPLIKGFKESARER